MYPTHILSACKCIFGVVCAKTLLGCLVAGEMGPCHIWCNCDQTIIFLTTLVFVSMKLTWSLHEVYNIAVGGKGKSCVKGRVCCHKPPPIFAIVPQSFEAVSLHQKFYQNHFSLKTLLNPYWKLWYEAGSDDLRRSEKRWFSGGDGRREIYLCLPEQKDAYGREGT